MTKEKCCPLEPMQGHPCSPPIPLARPPMLLAQGSLVPNAEPLPTPWIVQCGGKKYQILPVTTSDQVVMSNGSLLETRMTALERAIANNPSHKDVATIDERNALQGLMSGDTVYVADATGDPSVKKGGASYTYLSDGTWRKDMEDEAMDVDWVAPAFDGNVPEELAIGGICLTSIDINDL